MLLGYLVADQIRHLPSGTAGKAPNNAVAVTPASVKAPPPAEPTRAAPPAAPLEAVKPPADPEQRVHPVALLPLDADRSRYPASPSDPIGEFALVLPAPVEKTGPSAESSVESRSRVNQPATDLTNDLTHLRLNWPQTGSALAMAPAEQPSPPSAAGAGAATPANPAVEPTRDPSRVTAVEPPAAPIEPSLRGLPDNPVENATPPGVPDARARSASRGEPAPRNATRSGTRTARTQQLPPPPRRLASAYAPSGPGMPSLVCNSPICGPRLLLLGVGF
jgi:hypothetical protein